MTDISLDLDDHVIEALQSIARREDKDLEDFLRDLIHAAGARPGESQQSEAVA